MAQAVVLPTPLSFEGLLAYGWNTLKEHFTYLIKVMLLMFVISTVPSMIASSIAEESPTLGGLLSLAATIWGMIVSIGLLKLMFELLRTGKEPVLSLDVILAHKHLFLRYLGGNILFGLLVAFGFILLIIPGFYFMLKYMFVPYLIVDKEMTVGDAFKRSAEITKGKKPMLFFYMIGLSIFAALGVLALFVGLLVTIPITYIAWLALYLIMEKENGQV